MHFEILLCVTTRYVLGAPWGITTLMEGQEEVILCSLLYPGPASRKLFITRFMTDQLSGLSLNPAQAPTKQRSQKLFAE